MITGFVMHRNDFCVAGMFRDLFLFKRTKKIKSLILLVFTSMILFEFVRFIDLLIYPFPLIGYPSLSNFIGGIVFGTGMVLAGGCVIGVLYKVGAGSIISLTALIGIFIGSAIYAELHPYWIKFIKMTTLTKDAITLSQFLKIQPYVIVLIISIPLFGLVRRYYKAGDFNETFKPEGYISSFHSAIILSLVGLISYIFIGMPLGITTTYSKIAGLITEQLFPEYFKELVFYKVISLKYKFPLTGQELSGGPGPVFDAITAIQLPLIIGILLGSFISAIHLREFKVYFKAPYIQYFSAFIGGILIGLASRLTPACNVWHIFGGLPIFAIQSVLFVIGLFPGVWFGTKLLQKVIFR
ncbi:MAG TPA: YeeE/YedE family protein [Nitrospirae bacterium]|nr:YeeE/YedE family protein [Nitrospirota bacterium]